MMVVQELVMNKENYLKMFLLFSNHQFACVHPEFVVVVGNQHNLIVAHIFKESLHLFYILASTYILDYCLYLQTFLHLFWLCGFG